MAAERDFELLDDYLSNRLDDKGRSAVEDLLRRDPQLKAEFELQKEFIDGIRSARIAELKAMLNNVPVPAINTGSTLAKIAIGMVLAAVGTGAYFYFQGVEPSVNQTEQGVPADDAQPAEQPRDQRDTAVIEHEDSAQEAGEVIDQSPVVPNEPAATGERPVDTPQPVTQSDRDTAEGPTSGIRPQAFDPTASEEGKRSALPTEGETLKPSRPSITVEIEANHRRYHFHYEFKDDKLYLYGPFEGQLYEILEFFSQENKRTVFLWYNDKYYLLDSNDQKPQPLKEVNDPVLIKKLKEYQKK